MFAFYSLVAFEGGLISNAFWISVWYQFLFLCRKNYFVRNLEQYSIWSWSESFRVVHADTMLAIASTCYLVTAVRSHNYSYSTFTSITLPRSFGRGDG